MTLAGTCWTDQFTVGDMNLTLVTCRTDFATLAEVQATAA